jgi:lysophospholipase L1-like esterase|tara:strand:+ start:61 stop:795 length:735 start_codon:yes stop_codon:yes gene_type:complete
MKTHLLIIFLSLTLISCNQNEIIINAGIGGNTTNDLLNRINKDVIEKEPNISIIMIGTNDMLNSKKMISYNEYQQNLKNIVYKLKKENIKVVLCSPPTVDSIYLFERHNKNLFIDKPNRKLDSISKIINKISIEENIYFIDLNTKFREMNIPIHNKDNYLQNERNSDKRDGVHPTELGYSLISETIFSFLMENNLITQKTKIVCFGDSITFGVGSKGEGTSYGTTYPAILKENITKTFANTVYN